MPGRGAPAPALTTKASMPQTQVYNLAGNPAVSLPCGFDEQGLPLGVQLAARHFEEALLLRVAAAYEAATPWRERRPPLPA
jgi:aspartyl-tRNA(Asn)/glutamyl-tRNA(Gln) amidotransferase subunit A